MKGEKDRPDEASERHEDGPLISKSQKHTRRYSKRIILVFIIGVGALIGLITVQTRFERGNNSSQGHKTNLRAPQPSGFAELAAEMRRDRKPAQPIQIVMPEERESVPEPKPAPEPEPTPVQRIVIEAPRRERVPVPSIPRYYSNKDDSQAAATLRMLKFQALTAKPLAENFELTRNEAANTTQRDAVSPPNTVTGNPPSVMDSSMMAALMQQGQQSGQSEQAGKIDFLRNGGGSFTPQGYSASLPVPQQFPYELKAGTIIPGIMITGINSDLPGSIIAQVSENVWDTATGRHVLIPKGTRILGVYDSEIAFGQRRVLLVWNRLVFPNGTTLDIAGSPGVDQAGYSGLSGNVNEHWGTMLKTALFASVFVAGAEIVYGEDSQSTGNENKSPRDVAAESLAGAILDMGSRLMDRASGIQPTISIRPGKRMGIFVQRDVVFPYPYF